MRVLIATTEVQGYAPGDSAHAVAGELVTATVTQCDCPDCGCNRGFVGLASRRATTTAMVVEHPHVTTSDLRDVIYDHLVAGGWLDLLRDAAEARYDDADDVLDTTLYEIVDDPNTMLHELVDEHLDLITFICNRFEPGTVICRSGTLVWSREWPNAA
jgi:hypothetical protein